MVSMMECLTLCFVRKHQGIAQIMNRHVINPLVISLITLSTASGTILSLVTFMMSGIGRDQQMEFVRENYPTYYQDFSTLRNFAIYEFNFTFKLIAVGSFFAVSLFSIFFFFLIFDIFDLLRGVKKQISARNFQRHRAAVVSLVAQLVTSSLCLMPPIGLVIAIISHYEHSQAIVRILLAIFALHSTINAVVLIISTPAYWNLFQK
uniref:G_PROTEIN_RECEP_F1_2 domain-containing protein n=1 Tax=Caenorhabditis tropicalis TaxID=1561998 RepID=A0A1I7UKW4_9PELO